MRAFDALWPFHIAPQGGAVQANGKVEFQSCKFYKNKARKVSLHSIKYKYQTPFLLALTLAFALLFIDGCRELPSLAVVAM